MAIFNSYVKLPEGTLITKIDPDCIPMDPWPLSEKVLEPQIHTPVVVPKKAVGSR